MKVLLFLMLSFKLFSFNPSEDEVSIDPSFGVLINDLSYSRYKLSVKNLAFNRLGCYYLIENNNYRTSDLLGLNFRVGKSFFLNIGYQMFTNTDIFNGNRKEVGFTYSFNSIPIILNLGYSQSMGSSINIGYRFYLKQKEIKW